MKKLLALLLVLAAGGLLWFGISARHFGAIGTLSGRSASKSAPAHRDRTAWAGDAAVAHAGKTMTQREFEQNFHISGVDAMQYRSEMSKVRRDLMEQKGTGAQVASFDGKVLKMIIPALSVPNEEVASAILPHLRTALGGERAGTIWADPASRQMVTDCVYDDMLKCDVVYSFVKVRDENDPNRNGTLGEAAFDLTVTFAPRSSDVKRLPNSDVSTMQGFTYSRAGDYDFGWNAMSKAPSGFFRSEPILGVASRPGPTVFVVEDLDNGTAEIRNNRYPGSKDTLKDGKLIESDGDNSGSK